MHTARGSSQAWGQVLGLVVEGGVSRDVAQQWIQGVAYLAFPVLLLGLLVMNKVPFGQGVRVVDWA